jgi:hypothetical protein
MPRRRRRPGALLGVLLSLLAFGAGLVSPCLPVELGYPGYYDGDEDDFGIVQERFSWAPPGVVAQIAVPVVIPRPSRLEPSGHSVEPSPAAVRRPAPRAPPASPA